MKSLNDDNFFTVSFRPSTVFGVSPRLRCDIVYNNLVACAYTTNKIEIKSDGTPWRPVIHVRDVVDAIIAGLKAPKELVFGKAYNVGIENGNYMPPLDHGYSIEMKEKSVNEFSFPNGEYWKNKI